MRTISIYERINKSYNNLLNSKNRIPSVFVLGFIQIDSDWWFYVNN